MTETPFKISGVTKEGYDPRGAEPDPERWIDWEREAADRAAMHEAAIGAGCTELQARTLLLLISGVSAREIARQRGCTHTAVLGVRDRAMRRIIKQTGQPQPRRAADYWEADAPVDGLTGKQRYVLSMRDWHGHKFPYIAANMGITRQAVWSLYRRGLRWARPGEIRGGGRPWGAGSDAKRPAGSGRMGQPPRYHVD